MPKTKRPKTMPNVVHVVKFRGRNVAVTNSELREARKRYLKYKGMSKES